MRRKHSLFYLVARSDEKCWWARGKWHKECVNHSSNFAQFYRKDRALRCLDACPAGSYMYQFAWHNGVRLCTTYYKD